MAKRPNMMSDLDKKALLSNRSYIVNQLDLSDIEDHMRENNIGTADHFAEMKRVGGTEKGMNREFLDWLPKRGPAAFKAFIDALEQSEQGHIAKTLKQWQLKQPTSVAVRGTNQSRPPVNVAGGTKRTDDTAESPEDLFCVISEMTCITKSDIGALLEQRKEGDVIYKMGAESQGSGSKTRGKAIVISNQLVIGTQKDREGASVDITLLTTLFEQLGLESDVEENLTAKGIKKLVEDQCKDIQSKHYNCFLMFILSPGAKGYVYGTDGERVSIEDDIIAPFCGDQCPDLMDKPKAFFIQACQGETVSRDGGMHTSASTSSLGGDTDSTDVRCDSVDGGINIARMLDDLTVQDDAIPVMRNKTKPGANSDADVVVLYSTAPGYSAWKNPNCSSWFVTSIVNAFRRYAHQEHLVDLITRVCNEVSNTNQGKYYKDSKYKQLTKCEHTFKKKLYFVPERQ